MAVLKEVKEYSGRQRINLNKSDGFNENEEVYIMKVSEYEKLKQIVIDFEVYKEKAISEKETAITTANETSKEVLQNIHAEFKKEYESKENIYKEQLEEKETKIKELETNLNNLKSIVSNFLIQLNGLKLFDFIFRNKHKDLIDDMGQSVWIVKSDVEVISNDDHVKIEEK